MVINGGRAPKDSVHSVHHILTEIHISSSKILTVSQIYKGEHKTALRSAKNPPPYPQVVFPCIMLPLRADAYNLHGLSHQYSTRSLTRTGNSIFYTHRIPALACTLFAERRSLHLCSGPQSSYCLTDYICCKAVGLIIGRTVQAEVPTQLDRCHHTTERCCTRCYFCVP